MTTSVQSPTRRPTVLVVEDEPITRDIVGVFLTNHGFDPVSAESGGEAMAHIRLRTRPIDWLFTDIRLPGPISGLDVAEAFHLLHPFRPIVYATGSRVPDVKLMPQSILLSKPYRAGQVVDAFLTLERQASAWNKAPRP